MWGLSTRIDYYPQIGGNSGLFVSPTNPGLTYRFKVQGINTSAYDVSWSAWSNPKEVQAVAPLHSLRQFFAEIDLNQGIRSHLPNKMGNLRILMGL